jgi:hypothetical protein
LNNSTFRVGFFNTLNIKWNIIIMLIIAIFCFKLLNLKTFSWLYVFFFDIKQWTIYFTFLACMHVSLAQVWTCYSTNWIPILSFDWIYNDKNYSCALGLKFRKSPLQNPIHWALSKISKSCPNSPKIVVLILLNVEWWNCSIFNNYYIIG